MRQSFKGETRDIITMEEYLKKRQAMTPSAERWQRKGTEEPVTALKLAELLFV